MNEMLPEMLVGIMLEMVTGSPTTPKGGLGELLAAYEATQAAEVAEGSASTDAAGAQLSAQQKDASMLVQKAAGTVRPPTGQFGHGIRAGNTFYR